MGPSRLRFKRLVGIHHSTGLQGMDGTAATRSDGFLIGAWGEGGTSLPLSVRACRQIRTGSLRPTSYSYACQGRTYKRPWPRHGRRSPPAPIQAAVGVRGPLPQNPGSGRRSGAIPVGAALAATGRLQSAGFDTRHNREQARSHGLRSRQLSGSEDPSHRNPAHAPTADRAHPLWERPWPRLGHRRPQASMQAAVGVKTPPTETRPTLRRQIGRIPCGSGLGRDRAPAVRRLRCRPCRGQKTPPTEPGFGRRSGAIPVGAA